MGTGAKIVVFVAAISISGCASKFNHPANDNPPAPAEIQNSTPVASSKLVLSPPSDPIVAGKCSSPFTVSGVDGQGVPITSSSAVTVDLSSTGLYGNFYTDPLCRDSGKVSSIAIPPGSSSAVFYFSSNVAQSSQIKGYDSNAQFLPALLAVTINADVAAHLAAIGPTGDNFIAGQCTPLTLVAQDLNNNNTRFKSASTVSVAVNGSDFADLYSDPNCQIALSSDVGVSSGSAGKVIYYLKTATRSLHFDLDDTGASQLEAGVYDARVMPGPPRQLKISGPSSVVTGVCQNNQFTVTVVDQYGNPSPAASDLAVDLAGQGQGLFYGNDICTSVVSSMPIPAGQTSKTFYFRDMAAEATPVPLNAADHSNVLNPNTYYVTVTGGAATRILMTGDAQIPVAGCGNYEVDSTDSNGNPSRPASDTSVLLSDGGKGGQFLATDCLTPISSVTVTAASGKGVFRYKNGSVQALQLKATDPAPTGSLGIASLNVQVNALPASALALSGSTHATTTDGCVALTVQTFDLAGNVANYVGSTPLPITLSDSPVQGGQYFSDSSCLVPGSATGSIASGQNQAVFYYRNTQPQPSFPISATASANGFGQPTWALSVGAGAAANLDFGASTTAPKAADCVTLTLRARDRAGNLTAFPPGGSGFLVGETAVSGGSGQFFTDASCGSGGTNAVPAASGATQSQFSYKNTKVQSSLVLAIAATGTFTNAPSVTLSIGAAGPSRLVLGASTLVPKAGECVTITLQAQDASGNPTSFPSSPTTFAFTETAAGGAGSFFSDAACGTAGGSSVTVAASATQGTFSYKNLNTQNPVTLAAAPSGPFTNNPSVSLNVQPAVASLLVLQSSTTTPIAGECVALTIKATDGSGTPAPFPPAPTSLVFGETVTAGTGTFYTGGSCGTAGSAGVTVPSGAAQFQLSYRNTHAQPSVALSLPGSGPFTNTPSVSLNIAAAAPSQLALSSSPSSPIASDCVVITVKASDAFLNPTAFPAGGTTLALSEISNTAGAGSLFADATCGTSGTSLPVAGAAPLAQFSYRNPHAPNTAVLGVNGGSGFTNSPTVSIGLGSGPAALLTLTASTGSPRAGDCVTLSLHATDVLGNPTAFPATPTAMTIGETAVSGGAGSFFSDTSCATPGTAGVTIPASAGVFQFSYKNLKAQSALTLVAPATGPFSNSPSVSLDVLPGAPVALSLAALDGDPIPAGACRRYQFQLQDLYANPAPVPAGQSYAIDVVPAGTGSADYFADNGLCNSPLSAGVPVLAGQSSGSLALADVKAEQFQFKVREHTGTAGISPSPQLTVNVSAGAASSLALASATSITAGSCQDYTVSSMDLNGNPVPLASATWIGLTVAPSGGSAAFAVQGTSCGTTLVSANGSDRVQIASGAGSQSFSFSRHLMGAITLAADGTAAGLGTQSLGVQVNPGSPPTQLQLTSVPSPLQAGACQTVTVSTTDAFGNPSAVAGSALVVALSDGSQGGHFYSDANCGNDLSAPGPAAVTMAVGAQTLTFSYKNTTTPSSAVTMTTTSQSGPATLPAAASVTFAMTSSGLDHLGFVPRTPVSQITADDCREMIVSLRDSFGNPVAAPTGGVALTLSGGAGGAYFADSGCSTAAASPGVTAGTSAVSYWLRNTTPQPGPLTLTAGVLSGGATAGTVAVTGGVVPGAPSKWAPALSSTTPTTDDCVSMTVALQDAWNNVISPVSPTRAFNLSQTGQVPTTGAFYGAVGCTGSAITSSDTDHATVYYRNATVQSGPITLTVSGGTTPNAGNAALPNGIRAGAPDHWTLASGKSSVSADDCTAFDLSVQDKGGNPLSPSPALPYNVAQTGNLPGSGAFYSDAACTVAITGADTSHTRFYYRNTAPQGGPITLSVSGSSLVSASVQIAAGVTVGAPDHWAVASSVPSVSADDCTGFTASLKDKSGNTISSPNPAVVYALSQAGNLPGSGAFFRDSGCNFAVTGGDTNTLGFFYRNTAAQAGPITLQVAGGGVATAGVAAISGGVRAGAVVASDSSIAASPSSGTPADGSSQATVTILLRDAHGNAVPGVTGALVSFASSDATDPLVEPAGATDASGSASGKISAIHAGSRAISITGMPAVSGTVSFVAGAPSPSGSTLAIAPTGNIVADGSALATVTITLKDALGNPLAGITPVLTVGGTGNLVTQASQPTDSTGKTTATIASTVAQAKSVGISSPSGLTAISGTVTFVPGAPSLANSSINVAPTGGITANGTATATVTITLKDGQGNPISGVTPQFIAGGTGNSLVQPASATNAFGQATGTISSVRAETKTLSISSPAGLSGATASVTFVPGAPSVALSQITGNPSANVTADGSAASTVTIVLKDAQGNPITGVVPQFTSTGTSNTLGEPAAATDASGASSGTIASTHAETKTLSISSPAGLTAVTGAVTFVAGGPNAANSTIAVAPSGGVIADGVTTASITLTLKDGAGNPISGLTPVLVSSGSGNTITQPASATNGSGQTTASIASTVAESKTISISSPTGFAGLSATVTFVPGPPSALRSMIAASPSSNITADGTSSATVTITLKDAQGNVISGVTPQFVSSGTGNSVTQPASATNALGQASGAIASTRAETKTLTISAPTGLTAVSGTATFVPGAPSVTNSTIAAAPSGNVTANGVTTTTVTITLKDAQGNPVVGFTPLFTSSGLNNTLVEPSTPTNAAGQATGTIASTRAELKTLSVSGLGGVNGTVTFVAGPPASSHSTIAASPASNVTADGVSTSTVTITLQDAQGNPVSGLAAQIAASGTGNIVTQPASATDLSGLATGTIASTHAETKTLAISGPTGLAAVSGAVTFVPGGPSVANSTIAASPTGNVIANGSATSTVTITLKDAQGNPIAGITPQITSSGSANSIVQPASATNALGQSTATIASTKAETKTISISVPAGMTAVTGAVAFVPGPVDSGKTTLAAVPAVNVTADGVTSSTLTATLRDFYNNPITGVTTVLAVTGTGGNALTQPGAPTDSSGVATGSLKSTLSGTKTVSIISPSGLSSVSVGVTFNSAPPDAAHTTIAFAPTGGIVADGTASSTVTITLKDSNGNPVVGITPAIAATGTGTVLTQPIGATDSNGQTTASVASTHAELKTVWLGSPAGLTAVSGNVGFIAGAPAASGSTLAASPSSGIPADGSATTTVTITLVDAHGNPVSGITPVLAVTGTGGNTLVQPVAATNASGQTTATLKSTVSGTKTLSISSPAGLPGVTTSVVFVPGPAAVANSTIAFAPTGNITADGVATTTVTLTIKDGAGNPIAGTGAAFTVSGSGNTVTPPTGTTDVNGQFSATVASTHAESKTVQISTPAGLTAVSGTVSFVPGVPSLAHTTIALTPSGGVTADGTSAALIAITLADANGNAIAGTTPTISVSGSSNTASAMTVTSATGYSTGTLKSTKAESKTVAIVTPAAVSAVSGTIAFLPGAPVAANSTIAAAPTGGLTADGVTTSAVTITLRDANGNTVSGITPSFTSSGSANTLTQASTGTNASGQAGGTIASTKAESKTLSISSPTGLSAVTGAVAFVAGSPSGPQSSLAASPSSGVPADGTTTSTITVTVKDSFGNPVQGVTPTLSVSGSGNTLVGPSGATNSSGQTTATLASTKAETKTVTVSAPGALSTVSTTVAFVAASPSALVSTIVMTPSTGVVADGSSSSSAIVTLRDAHNNPVIGATVSLNSTGTGNTITQPATTTDSNGQTTASIVSTKAEAKVLSIASPTGLAAVTGGVTFVAGAPILANSTITVSPTGNVTADGATTASVTITLRDANNNPVPGVTGQFASNGTGNTLSQSVTATNASGQVSGTIASTKAESKTLSISAPTGFSSATTTVAFVAGAPSGPQSTLAASPTSNVTANGSSSSTLTITLKDAFGNFVQGITPVFAVTGTGGNTLTQPAVATNSSGQTTGSLVSNQAGTKTVTVTSPTGLGSLSASIGFIPGAPSATNSTLAFSPTGNIIANGTATTSVTITLKDSSGNPLVGTVAGFSSSGSNNTVTPPTGTTDSNGQFTATLASTTAETKTVQISTPAGLTAVSGTISFVPGSADPSHTTLAMSPSGGVTANGTAVSTISIVLADANGNLISGTTPTITVGGMGNTVSGMSVTSATGYSTGTVKSTHAETKNVAIATPASVTAVSGTVTFVAGAATIANSTLVASPTGGVAADGTATSTVTITLKDANSNPVAGTGVAFTSSGSGNTLTPSSGTTDANGQFSATIASTHAETKTLQISTPSGLTAVSGTVAFVPGGADPSHTTIAMSPTGGLTANGTATSTIAIVLADVNGNAISGVTPTITVGGTGNTVSGMTVTSATGYSTGTVKSTHAETKTVAIATPAAVTAVSGTVTFIPGAPVVANSTIVPSPTGNVAADGTGSSTVTITLKDANSNVVSGTGVAVGVSGTSISWAASPTGTTDTNGQFAAVLASTGVGNKSVFISSPAGMTAVSGTVAFVVGPASPSFTTIGFSPSTLTANGTASTTVTVTLKDGAGNPISGVTPTIAVSGSNNTVTGMSVTTAAGASTGTIKSTTAESKAVTITSPASVSAVSGVVNFIAGAPVVANSTISLSPSSVTADGVSTTSVTITLKDANNNVVANTGAAFTSTGTSNTITPPTGTTNASGQYVATLASTKAETKTVQISTPAGMTAVSGKVIFQPGAAVAGNSTVTTSPTGNVIANGVASSTVTVTLKDQFLNAVSGVSVSLNSTGSNNTIAGPTGVTNTSGTITGTIKSTTAETKVVSVVGLAAASGTVTFVAGPPDATKSTIAFSPSSGVTADGSSTSTVTITVLDANSNPIAGTGATFAVVTGSNNTLVQPGSVTDVNGQASGTIASTTAETKKLKIATPTAITAVSGFVTFAAGAADHLVKVQGDNQSSPIGTVAPTSPEVRVVDRYGNAVGTGISLTFTPSAGSTASPTGVTSDATGLAATAWTLSMTPGANTLSVAASPVLPDLAGSGNASVVFAATGVVASHQGWFNVQAIGATTPAAQSGINGVTGYININWNDMTINSGTISSYNVYRATSSGAENFAAPAATGILAGAGNHNYTDTSITAGNVYYYVVKPVLVSGLEVPTNNEVFAEIKVTAAPNNMVLVHRWIANQEMCGLMGLTPDSSNNYRCAYTGLGGDGTYFDIKKSFFVDAYEAGCNYTYQSSANQCGNSYGCLGTATGAPSTAVGAVGNVFYSRGDNGCYIKTSSSLWNHQNDGVSSAALATLMTNSPGVPPLTQISPPVAMQACGAVTVSVPAVSGLPIAKRLLTRKEHLIAAAWPPALTDANIISRESSSNIGPTGTGYCNVNFGQGLTYETGVVPANLDTIPSNSTAATYAGRHLVRTGSNATALCVSRYGAQDMVGNAAEFVSDQIKCDSVSHTCTGSTSAVDPNNADLNGFKFDGIEGIGGSTGTTTYVNFSFGTSASWSKFLVPFGIPISPSDTISGATVVGSGAGQIPLAKLHDNVFALYTDVAPQTPLVRQGLVGGDYINTANFGNGSAGRFHTDWSALGGAATDTDYPFGFRCMAPAE